MEDAGGETLTMTEGRDQQQQQPEPDSPPVEVDSDFITSSQQEVSNSAPPQSPPTTTPAPSTPRYEGQDGRPAKVNLYSENVVQEGDTTESVDRESIANLLSTRRQWEDFLHTTQSQQEATTPRGSGKKSTVRHWEVKIPTKSRVPLPDTVSSSNAGTPEPPSPLAPAPSAMSDSGGPPGESAIEREIRLANEREELLRREKEARLQAQQQQEKQQAAAMGKVTTAAVEADEQQAGETTRASFHELTEADRGSEMWQRERLIQQELLEQQQKEEEVRRRAQPAHQQQQLDQADGPDSRGPPSTESVIEREIRLQREREEELERQRQLRSQKSPRPDTLPTSSPAPAPAPSPAPSPAHPEVQSDINHNEAKAMSGGGQPPSFQHEGESIIARELRELREREEELRRLREGRVYVESPREEVKAGHASTPSANHHASSASTTPTSHPAGSSSSSSSWQRDVSPYLMPAKRSGSVDSLASSHSTGRTPSDATPSRDIKVTPFQDSSPTEEDAPPPRAAATETPIAREIRLARERENELRRAKGLPELPPVTPTQGSADAQSPSSGNSGGGGGTARYRGLDSGNTSTMKKFATGRLQQEILVQKQRELDLRKEGKIITTSEEHIEPLRYADVIGEDRSSGAGKRNFTTKKTPTYSLATDLKVEIDEVDSGRPGKGAVSSSSASPGEATLQRRKVSGAPATFSYKESKQSAESKIERELREMREREEEHRSRRGKGGAVTNGEGAARD